MTIIVDCRCRRKHNLPVVFYLTFSLSPGYCHHHSESRRPDRYSCRSDAGEQDCFRKPADPRPLRPSGEKTNKAICTLKREASPLHWWTAGLLQRQSRLFPSISNKCKVDFKGSKVNILVLPDARRSAHHKAFHKETRRYCKVWAACGRLFLS